MATPSRRWPFRASPGCYVTGNLYRPRAQASGRRYPAVLNPHGHWPQGRLAEEDRGSVPARCITFARQGFVAFSYDMVGYLDSRQVDHRTFGGWREWLWGIHSLGLATLELDPVAGLSDRATGR